MQFIKFAQICERLEMIPARLEMIDIIASELPGLSDEELPVFIRFLMGRIFPDWTSLKTGIGPNLVYEGVAYVTGKKKSAVIDEINAGGDAGLAVEHLLANKEQMSFFTEDLDLVSVYHDFEYVADAERSGTQKEKLRVIKRLFANARPLEGRYLSRLMLGELRIGIGEGSMRDSIAKAFDVPADLVEHAQQAVNDLGEVVLLAKKGPEALADVRIELFRPVKMMLARQGTITDMLAEHGEIAAECKYDGTRFQFHKSGNECRIYSRKLEEVTGAIPDVVRDLLDSTEHDVILDGEVIAVKDGRPLPFQFVLRRFRRKHDIASHMEEIKLVPNVFDILYLDGKTLIDLPFSERRKHLENSVHSSVAPQIVSGDSEYIESFYRSALDDGHEGIMVKSLTSCYSPGMRGKEWIKIKPAVDTMDLAVVGAEWGEGKRAQLFGSFLLACQDNGELIPVSKVGTGFSDEMLAVVYDMLKDLVISRSGKEVHLEPEIVFEVGYAEIQESRNYLSGYALRFPRFIRLRDDKGIDEIETLEQVGMRFIEQSK